MAETVKLAISIGFDPIPAPLLELVPGEPGPMVELIRQLENRRVAWIVFTSEHAVQAGWKLAAAQGNALGGLLAGGIRAAAVGPATQRALAERGVHALLPEEHSSGGLVRVLAREGLQGKVVALVRSDQGSAELPQGLAGHGAAVLEVPVYGLRMPRDLEEARQLVQRAAQGDVRAFAFTSSLTVRHLLALAGDMGLEPQARDALARAIVGAMGEPTARTLDEMGVRCDVVAPEASIDLLLGEMHKHLSRRERR